MILKAKKTLSLKGELLDLSYPLVMGILNITPDSFYDGGKYQSLHSSEAQLLKMVSDGASIIDIGGNSTRPGSTAISESEEIDRVLPSIEMIAKKYPAVKISIDTFRSSVAKYAVKAGACMVNDVSSGNIDEGMFETVARLKVPYVLTHMRGTQENMMKNSAYKNLMIEILTELLDRKKRLFDMGVQDVIIDPGIGFSKIIEQNYEILNKLHYLDQLNCPILVGVSRKSLIYKFLQIEPEQSLNGTSVLNTFALGKGANILRVHDVKEAVETIKLTKALTLSSN